MAAVDDGEDPGSPPRLSGEAAAHALRAVATRRVLVVDDNPDAADSLSTLLTLLGQTVRRAYDARTALMIAARHQPEMVFLDIAMPHMDGFEVARAIRSIAGLGSTPIVAVSGLPAADLEQQANAAGFARCLRKPVTLDTLIAVLGGSPRT